MGIICPVRFESSMPNSISLMSRLAFISKGCTVVVVTIIIISISKCV